MYKHTTVKETHFSPTGMVMVFGYLAKMFFSSLQGVKYYFCQVTDIKLMYYLKYIKNFLL